MLEYQTTINSVDYTATIKRKCVICKELKTLLDFYKNKSMKDGLEHFCKPCAKTKSDLYKKSEPGLITQIYGCQRARSKRRGHAMPLYTKAELRAWLYENGFFAMWCQWTFSGYLKHLAPSCDRIDSLLPYSFENLQLVTWETNNRLGTDDTRNGIGSGGWQCKSVQQIDPATGVIVAKYFSQNEAARVTGIRQPDIYRSISKGYKAGGYHWRSI